MFVLDDDCCIPEQLELVLVFAVWELLFEHALDCLVHRRLEMDDELELVEVK